MSQPSAAPPPSQVQSARRTQPAHIPTQTTTYLLARTTYLTSQLTRSLLALTSTANPQLTSPDDPEPFHPYVETADAGMQIEASAAQMIRAAEELRVLTEAMRALWVLSGSSDEKDGNGSGSGRNGAASMEEDEGKVVRGMQAWLARYAQEQTVNQIKHDVSVEEEAQDVAMQGQNG